MPYSEDGDMYESDLIVHSFNVVTREKEESEYTDLEIQTAVGYMFMQHVGEPDGVTWDFCEKSLGIPKDILLKWYKDHMGKLDAAQVSVIDALNSKMVGIELMTDDVLSKALGIAAARINAGAYDNRDLIALIKELTNTKHKLFSGRIEQQNTERKLDIESKKGGDDDGSSVLATMLDGMSRLSEIAKLARNRGQIFEGED